MTSSVKGIIQQRLETTSIQWKIEEFYGNCPKIGDCYESPPCSMKYLSKNFEWSLHVYPQGDNEDNKDYVSLYIHFASESKIKVEVNYNISIVSDEQIIINTKENHTDIFDEGPKSTVGWKKFIRQSILKDPDNIYLMDDTLMILCVITVNATLRQETANFYVYNEWLGKIESPIRDYEELLESGDFADVSVTVQDKKVRVHKAILSCRSPVFKAMFSHKMKENMQNSLKIMDVDYDVMKELFRFIYSRKVKNLAEIASRLLIAADKYQVIELKALCEQTLFENITVANAIEYLKLTEACDTIYLKTLVIQFVAKHYKYLVTKPEFADLDKNVIYEAFLTVAKNN